ncbi:MAG: hypothetical protein H7318_00420 [Oligoflexus sp.]|nr:hypothetical protein [Oligoflexus sp.]
MNNKTGKIVMATAIILLTVLYFGFSSWLEKSRRMENPTSYSNGPFGLSMFLNFRRSLSDRPAVLIRKPLLLKGSVAPGETLIIASPQRPVSDFEARILIDDVALGGNLYLSSHSEATFKNLQGLLQSIADRLDEDQAKLNLPGKDEHSLPGKSSKKDLPAKALPKFFVTVPDRFFEQQKLSIHDASSGSRLLKISDKIAFYSTDVFNPQFCKALDAARCYLLELQIGKGIIWFQLGAPLFSNALLGEVDNRLLTARLSEQSSRILFDEYHQFFEESDLGDFLKDPYVSLPLLGFIIICILAAGTSDIEQHLPEPPRSSGEKRNWSQLTIGLLKSQLRYTAAQRDAVFLQSQVLLKNYPELREEIYSIQEICAGELQKDPHYYQRFYMRLKALHRQARINRGATIHDPAN